MHREIGAIDLVEQRAQPGVFANGAGVDADFPAFLVKGGEEGEALDVVPVAM